MPSTQNTKKTSAKSKDKAAKNKELEKRILTEFTQSVLLSVEAGAAKEEVEQFLKQQSLIAENEPATDINWFNTEGESLKIKTVREIIRQTSYSSYSGSRPVYVLLNADNSSIPAQNALLKIVEEPPHGSLVVLTAQQPKQLLPTIRSRCVLINSKQAAEAVEASQEARQFCETLLKPPSYSEAVELAEKYKSREEAQKIITEAISHLYQQLTIKQDRSLVKTLQALLSAYQDLGKNLNTRLALEHYFFQIKEV